MKCPKCKKEIDSVCVLSTCTQRAELRGTKLINYEGADNIGETLSIHCPECDYDLKKEVEE